MLIEDYKNRQATLAAEGQRQAAEGARIQQSVADVEGMSGLSGRQKAAALNTLGQQAGAVGLRMDTGAGNVSGLSQRQALDAKMGLSAAEGAANSYDARRAALSASGTPPVGGGASAGGGAPFNFSGVNPNNNSTTPFNYSGVNPNNFNAGGAVDAYANETARHGNYPAPRGFHEQFATNANARATEEVNERIRNSNLRTSSGYVAPAPVQAVPVQAAVQQPPTAPAGYQKGALLDGLRRGGMGAGAERGFFTGGGIPGKSPKHVDDKTINVRGGEYVIPEEAVDDFGGKRALDAKVLKATGVPPNNSPGGLRAGVQGGFMLGGELSNANGSRMPFAPMDTPPTSMAPPNAAAAQAAAAAEEKAAIDAAVKHAQAARPAAPSPSGPVNAVKEALTPSPTVKKTFSRAYDTVKNLAPSARSATGIAGAALGAYDVAQGFRNQGNRDASDIDNRGGFLASALKDASPILSSVGEYAGQSLAHGVHKLTGGGGTESPSFGEILHQNTTTAGKPTYSQAAQQPTQTAPAAAAPAPAPLTAEDLHQQELAIAQQRFEAGRAAMAGEAADNAARSGASQFMPARPEEAGTSKALHNLGYRMMHDRMGGDKDPNAAVRTLRDNQGIQDVFNKRNEIDGNPVRFSRNKQGGLELSDIDPQTGARISSGGTFAYNPTKEDQALAIERNKKSELTNLSDKMAKAQSQGIGLRHPDNMRAYTEAKGRLDVLNGERTNKRLDDTLKATIADKKEGHDVTREGNFLTNDTAKRRLTYEQGKENQDRASARMDKLAGDDKEYRALLQAHLDDLMFQGDGKNSFHPSQVTREHVARAHANASLAKAQMAQQGLWGSFSGSMGLRPAAASRQPITPLTTDTSKNTVPTNVGDIGVSNLDPVSARYFRTMQESLKRQQEAAANQR